MKRIEVIFILFTISILMNLYVTANQNTIGNVGQTSAQSNMFLQPGDSYVYNMSSITSGKISYSSNISYEVASENNFNGNNAYCVKDLNTETNSTSFIQTLCQYYSANQFDYLGYKGYSEFGTNVSQSYENRVDYNQTMTGDNFTLPYSDGNFTEHASSTYYSVDTWNLSSGTVLGSNVNYLNINSTYFGKDVVTSEYKNTDVGNLSSWKITYYPMNATDIYESIFENGTISHGVNITTYFLNNFTAEFNANGTKSYIPMDQIYGCISTYWMSKDYRIIIAEQDNDSLGNLCQEGRIVKLTILPRSSTAQSLNTLLSSSNTLDTANTTPKSNTNSSNTGTTPSFLLIGSFLTLIIISRFRRKHQ